MVIILEYVLLGLVFYIVIIPILEQLSTLICQGLETLKGFLIYRQSITQKKIDDISKDSAPSVTQAIGFSIPIDEEYEEDIDD